MRRESADRFHLLCGLSIAAICIQPAIAAPGPLPSSQAAAPAKTGNAGAIGRYEVFTIPFDPKLTLRTGTYTPSGKVLVSYAKETGQPVSSLIP